MAKRILAIIGIVLLIAMYAITIVAALSDSPDFMNYLMGSVGATIMVPVLIWLGIMLFKNKDK